MKTIATFGDGLTANLAKARLGYAGIDSYLADEQSVGVAWHLANAIGGIKLQVADEQVDDASAILAEKDEDLAALDEIASKSVDPDVTEFLATDAVAADEVEIVPTQRELNADRALRGAVLGIFLFPMQLYIFYLLLKVFVSDEPLAPPHRRNALIAAAINLPFVMGILIGIKAWLP